MTRLSQGLWILIACLVGSAGTSRAGTLVFYEASAGQGQVRALAGPVTNVLVDVDYAPSTAEGGKLFGMSEIEIEATGDLLLTPTGFACQATACLYSPLPFVEGKKIRITAGDDLVGETDAARNLLTIGVTGSVGHIVVTRGEYLDGTGPGGSVGSVQSPAITILVTVPEVQGATGLAAAAAFLALAGRRRGRAA